MEKKEFITIRVWKETKDKLEEIRIKEMLKTKQMVSLAKTIEILIETYNNQNKKS